MSNRIKVLGVSASLRNARFGSGSTRFISDLLDITTVDELTTYLEQQTKILLHEFFEKGRLDNRPFTDLYDVLRKAKGDRGLSNSEAALGAGLWGASQENAHIDYCGLGKYFPPNGSVREVEDLRQKICDCDAILLAGPVYFGDRGSLAQRFFEFLENDPDCRRHINGLYFAGITVGAKRNGGQETTLIYQVVDACNLGMLVVGNNSETTAQYGGTAVAGDVGTLAKDHYGIITSISTGRRLARSSRIYNAGRYSSLQGKLRIGIWLLQDTVERRGEKYVSQFIKDICSMDDQVEVSFIDATQESIFPCIACDICPTKVGFPDEYRCIISQERDMFVKRHLDLISVDAFLLAAYSPKHWGKTISVYQKFIERTRYLRRDDYVLGHKVVAPLVFSEVGANQNLHLRILTSLIRHSTVLYRPIIGFEYLDEILNKDDVTTSGKNFIQAAKRQTLGVLSDNEIYTSRYSPVGYEISTEKTNQELNSAIVRKIDNSKYEKKAMEKAKRIS